MIYLLLDFLLSFTPYKTYFILLNIVTISKNKYFSFLVITLILDLLILNTYFLNTIILSIIFFIYKKLNFKKINLKNFFLSLLFIYSSYIILLGLINNYSFIFLLKYIIDNLLVNFLFAFFCYKLNFKHIKLSR